MNKDSAGRGRKLEIIAAIGLGIEALALTFAALAYGFYAIFGDPRDVGFIAGIGVFCLALAVGVGFGARGMWQSRRWARSIALTWQVFQAGLGLSIISSRPVVAAILIVVALAIAGCVMARAGKDDAPAASASA
ncbi:hypothetical protein [Demequina aurantiaca]|uniref:hypothetical protein n=1 Tax=Demequina aurantiaca TaxID=676200 RepID=UPI0007858496|nr:hypothetical protein [Demequina aurantiaca]